MATISSQQFFGGGKAQVIGNEANIQQNESKNGASFFSELLSDIKETGADIKSSFMRGVDKTQQALDAGVRGEQGALRTTGQIIGQGADVVSNIFGDVLKGTAKALVPQGVETAVKSGIESVANPIVNSELVKNVLEKYNQLDDATKRDIEASLGIVKLGTDVAGLGLGSKAGGVVSKQGAKALDVATDVGKDALRSTGKVLKAGGKEMFELGIPMSAKEAKLVQLYRKEVPFLERVKIAITGAESKEPITNANTALRNVFGGTESMIGTQAIKAKDNIWNGLISPALKSSNEILTKDELFSGIVKKISKITDPIKKASYEDAFRFIQDSYKNVDNWSMEMAQGLKQDLAEFLPQAVYNGKPIANELKSLKNEMANVIRKKIYNSIPDTNIRQAYLDYGNLDNLAKWGQQAMTGSKLKGGAGGFISGIKDMVVTPITTIGGKVLYKTGEGLEFIGKKGAKTVKDIIDDGVNLKSSGTKNIKLPKENLTSGKGAVTFSQSDDLIQEARKYKTAEEFVKAQGTPVYHGTNRIFDEFDISKGNKGRLKEFGGGEGIYFSPIKEVANKYTKSAQQNLFPRDKTIEVIRKKDALLGDIVEKLVDGGEDAVPSSMWKKAIQKEKTNGIDYNVAYDIAEVIESSKSAQPYQGIPGFGGFDPAVNKSATMGYTLKKKLGIDIGDIKKPREIETFVSKDAKIKDLGYFEDIEKKTKDDYVTITAKEQLEKEVAKAKKEGYHGVKFQTDKSIDNTPEINIWDTAKIKTKSQLTDIWKKANIDERLVPLVDKDGMVTVYRASAKFPDILPKNTYVSTKPDSVRYYAESWYKGNPSDIKVESFKVPASKLKRGGTQDNWQLTEDFLWKKVNKKTIKK